MSAEGTIRQQRIARKVSEAYAGLCVEFDLDGLEILSHAEAPHPDVVKCAYSGIDGSQGYLYAWLENLIDLRVAEQCPQQFTKSPQP